LDVNTLATLIRLPDEMNTASWGRVIWSWLIGYQLIIFTNYLYQLILISVLIYTSIFCLISGNLAFICKTISCWDFGFFKTLGIGIMCVF